MKPIATRAKRFLAATIPALVGLCSAGADAAPIIINPQADAVIAGPVTNPSGPDNTGNNYGAATLLAVRGNGFSGVYKCYLRFSLADIVDLSQVADVALGLRASNSGGSAGTWSNQSYSVYALDDVSWGEGSGTALTGASFPGPGVSDTTGNTITWDLGAPANNTGSISGFNSPAVLLGSFNANGSAEALFSSAAFTQFVKDATPSGTITLMLSTTGTGATQYIGARENSNAPLRPTLAVTVPEPATAGLIGMAGIALLFRRRC